MCFMNLLRPEDEWPGFRIEADLKCLDQCFKIQGTSIKKLGIFVQVKYREKCSK